MEKWYDLADVWRDKGIKESLKGYRSRVARTHARYVRHRVAPIVTRGRPKLQTFLTEAGVRAQYLDNEMPNIQPYPVVMRLTDAARQYIVEGNLFTTQGLEEPARTMSRDAFLQFVRDIGREDLFEPDFAPL